MRGPSLEDTETFIENSPSVRTLAERSAFVLAARSDGLSSMLLKGGRGQGDRPIHLVEVIRPPQMGVAA